MQESAGKNFADRQLDWLAGFASHAGSPTTSIAALLSDVSPDAFNHPETLGKLVAGGHWYDCSPLRAGISEALKLRTGAKVLEIGCRTGVLTRHLLERGCSVTAVEGNHELLELARQRCFGVGEVTFVQNLRDLAPESQYDYIFCVDRSFEDDAVPGPVWRFLEQCRDRLRPTGTLVLAVGNTTTQQGGIDVQLNSDHVRGTRLPLLPLVTLIGELGFHSTEPLLAFPHHVAPQLIVSAEDARRSGAGWVNVVGSVYELSSSSRSALSAWWRWLYEHKVEVEAAPGWIILAHRHRVHDVLLPESGAVKIELCTGHEQIPDSVVDEPGVVARALELRGSADISSIARIARPLASSVPEYREALAVAQARIEELLQREHDTSASFAKMESSLREEVAQWSEKARAGIAKLRLEAERGARLEQGFASVTTKLEMAEARIAELESEFSKICADSKQQELLETRGLLASLVRLIRGQR